MPTRHCASRQSSSLALLALQKIRAALEKKAAIKFVKIRLRRRQRQPIFADADDEEEERPLRIDVIEREADVVFYDDVSVVKEMKEIVPALARENPYLGQLRAAKVLKSSKRRTPVTKKTASLNPH